MRQKIPRLFVIDCGQSPWPFPCPPKHEFMSLPSILRIQTKNHCKERSTDVKISQQYLHAE